MACLVLGRPLAHLTPRALCDSSASPGHSLCECPLFLIVKPRHHAAQGAQARSAPQCRTISLSPGRVKPSPPHSTRLTKSFAPLWGSQFIRPSFYMAGMTFSERLWPLV